MKNWSVPVDRVISPHHIEACFIIPHFWASLSDWGLNSKSEHTTLSKCIKFHKIWGKIYSQYLLSLKKHQHISETCTVKWNHQTTGELFIQALFESQPRARVFTDRRTSTLKFSSLVNITNQNTISAERCKTLAWSLTTPVLFKFFTWTTKMFVGLKIKLLIAFVDWKVHCPKVIIESG